MRFPPEQVKAACRYLHSEGIERTPRQVKRMFIGMICDMRRWRPDETCDLTDEQVWRMVRFGIQADADAQ